MKTGIFSNYLENKTHGDDFLLTRVIGKDCVFDAVLDGVSMGVGKEASNLLGLALKNEKIQSIKNIEKILEKVNNSLYRTRKGMTLTTVTIAFKLKNKLTIISCGDSPAYLIRNNQIKDIAKLDKVGHDPTILTNAVGIGKDFRYHLNEISLKQGDKIILMTDGISDNLYSKEILEIVNKSPSPNKTILRIKELLKKKKKFNEGRRDFFDKFKPDDKAMIVRYL